MTSDFFQKAVDPKQYDHDRIDWTSEATVDSPFRKFVLEYIRDQLSEVTGKRVIDIGAGTGWLVKVLVELEAGSITAVEPSEKGAKFMREQHPSVIVQCSSIDEMDTGGAFDIGFLIYVSTHLENLEKSFHRIARVIKQGGVLVMVIPGFDYVKNHRLGSAADIEYVDDEVFIAGIPREFGMMYDIYRTAQVHIDAASAVGLELVSQIPMLPTEALMTDIPRYRPFADEAISELFIFKKI